MLGYIYLIHLREFINSKENIYKIGRCLSCEQRLKGYPKGSVILFSIYIKDHVQIETQLIKIFDETFERQSNIGREYYKGCLDTMLFTISKYCNDFIKTYLKPQVYNFFKIVESPANLSLSDIYKSKSIYSYEIVKNVFEKENAYITNSESYINLHGSFYLTNKTKIIQTYRNLYCFNNDAKKKFIELWLDDPNIKTYRNLVFAPPPCKIYQNDFNIWTGFAIDKNICENSNNIEPFVQHMKLLGENNDKAQDYLIKWLAHLIQEPGIPQEITLVFYSNDIFWDYFTKIVGNTKLLINVSEYSIYKGKKEESNLTRFIITPNKSTNKFDNKNYVTYKKQIEDDEYLDRLYDYMNDPSNQKAIIQYLRTIDLSNINWISDTQKSVCADPIVKYIVDIWQTYKLKKQVEITAKELLKNYHEFLETKMDMKESIELWNQTNFGLKIKFYCNNEKTGITKVKGNKHISYVFKIPILETFLQEKGYSND
jgi:hypothetical protein